MIYRLYVLIAFLLVQGQTRVSALVGENINNHVGADPCVCPEYLSEDD